MYSHGLGAPARSTCRCHVLHHALASWPCAPSRSTYPHSLLPLTWPDPSMCPITLGASHHLPQCQSLPPAQPAGAPSPCVPSYPLMFTYVLHAPATCPITPYVCPSRAPSRSACPHHTLSMPTTHSIISPSTSPPRASAAFPFYQKKSHISLPNKLPSLVRTLGEG